MNAVAVFPKPGCSSADNEYWRGLLRRSGTRLDAAQQAMTAATSADQPLPSEAEMGRLQHNLDLSRVAYRAAIEKLTGQSADDVQRRMSA